MKNTSLLRQAALLALTLGTAGLTTAFAQTAPTPPASESTQPAHDHQSALTADEKAQLQKAHDQVLADNPDLKTEDDNLTKQHDALKAQGTGASADDKQALHTAMRDHRDKMRAAMLKLDPTLAPIFAKQDAAHANKHP